MRSFPAAEGGGETALSRFFFLLKFFITKRIITGKQNWNQPDIIPVSPGKPYDRGYRREEAGTGTGDRPGPGDVCRWKKVRHTHPAYHIVQHHA
jgi:hypothetical protein